MLKTRNSSIVTFVVVIIIFTIVNFYGDKNEPIVVYRQIPFEGGRLVLAERFFISGYL